MEWDDSQAVRLGSAQQFDEYRALAAQPGRVIAQRGDIAHALGERALEALYEMPYLAHATMEPMNCVVQLRDGGCELWYGAQSLSGDQRNVAKLLGIAPERVSIHTLFAGGSFGRRADLHSDYVLEAVEIARALGDGRPLKLQWTRADDMRAGRYRPACVHRLRGAVDAGGRLAAWQQRIVGQPLFPGRGGDEVERTLHEGASNLPYAVPALLVDAHVTTPGVPVLWWRSVGHSHTAFAIESFIDELAAAAGADPVAFRLAHLADDTRRRGVLERAAREAGWGTPLAKGRGRGVAVHKSFGTHVVEVSVIEGGAFTLERVTLAVDCGIAVNPDVSRAQMEGGVGYALAAVLYGAITLEDGVVEQDNFDRYPVLRNSEMPSVDVHIIESREPPSGVGEPAVPPLAPALANALYAASGRSYRRMPFRSSTDA